MQKKSTVNFCICFVFALLLLQSCKNDSYLLLQPAKPSQSFTEEFDTSLTSAENRGWVIKNRSIPIGTGVWSQETGNDAFSSKSTNNGCIFSSEDCCHDDSAFAGTISNWVISPVITLQNNDRIIFYTKTTDGTWGDRLQVRANIKNTGTECGRGIDPGDFTDSLLDINNRNASNDASNYYKIPDSLYIYNPFASYPTRWTRFETIVTGLNGPTKGRFAFRHFVPNGGDNGMGLEVLLDSVAYISVSHR